MDFVKLCNKFELRTHIALSHSTQADYTLR